MTGPVSHTDRANWQIKQKNYITAYVDTPYNRGIAALGSLLKASSQPRFYVFNPLSWVRSDVADFPFTGKTPVTVIDVQTNTEVASQLTRRGGKQYIRIWAAAIPSVGVVLPNRCDSFVLNHFGEGQAARWKHLDNLISVRV